MKKNRFKDDGIVLLNKSRGITSFGAINRLKRLVGAEKTGHAGTLDPMAEGLLIVMVNNATKFSEDLIKKEKEYYVELELGYETDTYDTEGEVTKRYEGEIVISQEEISRIVNKFQGEIDQVPPMYSAIKIGGEKLYNLARKGIEVERKPRRVNIHSFREIKLDVGKVCKVSFFTEVGSGTYIRSLVRDIGEKTGFYATMTKLVRTKIDKFFLENSVSLEEIEAEMEKMKFTGKSEETPIGRKEKMEQSIIETRMKKMFEYMLEDVMEREKQEKLAKIMKFKNIDTIFNYEKITVSEEKYKNLKNGMTVTMGSKKIKEFQRINEGKLYSIYINEVKIDEQKFMGIAKVVKKSPDRIYLKRDRYFL